MATLQQQLDALRQAIASGATEVRYADGSGVKYRSLDEMRSVEASLVAQLTPSTVPGHNPSVALVSFAGRR